MKRLNIVECSGYTRQDAFSNLSFNPLYFSGANATRTWKKNGCPIPGTAQFSEWAEEQLLLKTRGLSGYGLYIITDPYKPDTRTSPCRIINNKTKGKTIWHIEYWLREDEFDPTSSSVHISKAGQIVSTSTSKSKIMKMAKDLTLQTHKNYTILRIRVPNNNFFSGYSVYTPANGAKKGTFIAFGYDRE